MKHKSILCQLKKLSVATMFALGAIAYGQTDGPALEMTSGSGNTTANGPTTANQIIYFQNNTNNPGGTTFATYAPTLSATYAISNIRSGNVINFGQTTTGAVPIFDLMNSQGAPSDANYTSAGAPVGGGISVATNRAVRLYIHTAPLRAAGSATGGTYQIADLTVTFNRPVTNPVIHIGALGGTSSSTPTLGFAGRLDLLSSSPAGVTLTRLSGTSATNFQTTSSSIFNGATAYTGTGAGTGSGSVRINGTGITSVTFTVSLKGDGANTATTAWAASNTDTATGEAFLVGFSTLESDIQVTKTMANTTTAVGNSTNFVVTATNNGPSNNANINITDLLPSGYTPNGTPTASPGTYNAGTGVWNIPLLNNGAIATLTIPVTVQATGNYINTATLTSAAVSDSNTGNNRATAARIPDTDGDGIFDNVDLDDDNDGIPDTNEDNCTKTTQIANGNFSGAATSWSSGFYTTPNTTGGITFTGTTLEIFVDNAGSLYSGNVILANTTPVTLRAGVYYNFSSTLSIFSGTTNVNFAWVLLDSSNNIVQTIQTYKTLASGIGDVQISNTATAYPVTFFSTGTGSYRLAMTWVTNSAANGNGQDVRIDDVTLFAPCDTDGDTIPNYLDLDSDADGCFDAIEGDENVRPTQLNANGSINTTANGGIGTTPGTNNGVPNLVNSGGLADVGGDVGQGIGDSQSSLANTQCIDSDGDGYPNNLDLDDDNDGILDTIEDSCEVEGTPVYINDFSTGTTRGSDGNVIGHTFVSTGTIGDGFYAVTTSGAATDTFSQTEGTGNLDAGNPIITAGSANGRYLMININSPVTVNQAIYRVNSLAVTPGTRYNFRIDMAGLAIGAGAVPDLQLSLKDTAGNLLASTSSGNIGMANDDVWRRLSLKFVATTSTVVLEIVNLQGNGGGNDIGIDNIILAPITICDTDSDGIPNSLDLDSDGDGCADAFEGAANIATSQLVTAGGTVTGGGTSVNQNICATGACVNTSGVPQFATLPTGYSNSTGQAIGQSQDASRNDCIDSDGDTVPDWQDLDDDNDGILDTVECGFVCATPFINGGFEAPAIAGIGVFINQSNSEIGWKTTATDGLIELWRTNSPAPAEGLQFAELNATQVSTLYQTFCLNGAGGTVNWSVKHRGRSGTDVAAVKFGPTIAAAQASTAVQTMSDGNTAWGTYSGTYNVPVGTTSLVIAFQSVSTSTGDQGQGNFIDDVRVVINQPCLDSDGDGIPNSLDLDSDNDGCSDAVEGGANFTAANLVTATGTISTQTPNQNLGNTVGNTPTTIGVPTIAGTGQTVGQSQDGSKNDCVDTDADGIPDWQDLDDDNDGILDVAECPTTLNDFIAAYSGGTTTNIVPSDFQLAFNVKNQNVTRDLSAKFGYPANSGAVIVSITNASVHPTQDVWWTKNGEQPSRWRVSGTMSAYVLMGNDFLYYANDSKTIHIYDNAEVIPVTVPGFANQTAVAGQWSITETPSQKTLNNLNTNSATQESANWRYINMNLGPKSFGFSTTVAFADPNYAVVMLLECDTDKDGIPNRLDLDSDNDGCFDSLEGDENVNLNQLNANGSINTTTTGGLGNVTANIGVPNLVNSGGSADIGGDVGQGTGDSQNALIRSCFCYKKPILDAGTNVPVQHGITALSRATDKATDWPVVRQSAWTVLEANTKGFVVNKVAFEDADNNALTPTTPVGIPTINYVEGMMVYDINVNCLKIYNGTVWNCYSTQACPPEITN